jgi:Family of unknown function (DUF6134)
MSRLRRVPAALAIASVTIAADSVHAQSVSVSPATREWRFNVFLDRKPIGHHYFRLVGSGVKRELISTARFSVKILFITAYRYAHDANEIWQDECLQSIDAHTNDNGTSINVRGNRGESAFNVLTGKHSRDLATCIQTFAYWNPAILSAKQLLNPQTGEYVPVTITHVGTDTLSTQGKSQNADRYRIAGEQLQIDLWYSLDRSWLALESTTKDGRVRYQLQ